MRNWGHPPTLEGPCDPWVPHPLFPLLELPLSPAPGSREIPVAAESGGHTARPVSSPC